MLFRVSLALLRLHEAALLAEDNPGELLRCARRCVAQVGEGPVGRGLVYAL